MAGTISFPVLAQDQASTDVEVEESVERIQVTGSRIPQSANVVSSSQFLRLLQKSLNLAETFVQKTW